MVSIRVTEQPTPPAQSAAEHLFDAYISCLRTGFLKEYEAYLEQHFPRMCANALCAQIGPLAQLVHQAPSNIGKPGFSFQTFLRIAALACPYGCTLHSVWDMRAFPLRKRSLISLL